jgi:hypothetical protein
MLSIKPLVYISLLSACLAERIAIVVYSCTHHDEMHIEQWITKMPLNYPFYRPNCHTLNDTRLGCTETHGILEFVLSNYENLIEVADIIFFTHAHRTSWHYDSPIDESIKRVVNHTTYLRNDFGNINCRSNRNLATAEWPASMQRDQKELWSTLFKNTDVAFPSDLAKIQYPCCGSFFARSRAIKRRPKETYETVLKNVMSTSYEDNHKMICGRVAESAWGVLFANKTFVEKPGFCS